MDKPILIFDGECEFCRHWVLRWQAKTGDRVDYAPSQEAAASFPQIPRETFAGSLVLVDTEGNFYSGSEAVFRALAAAGKKGPLWCYQKIPGWAPLTQWWYRRVANRRSLISRLSRWFLGSNLEPPTYYLPRRLFLILLSLIYMVAFVSLAVQIQGLIGQEGILPAGEYLDFVSHRAGGLHHWRVPTVFWLGKSDLFIEAVCWIGAALSILLILGYAPVLVTALLWFFYLSLYSVGQSFLSFQWDILLLETGFLAIFLAPLGWTPKKAIETKPPRVVLWLLRWLLFRLIFLSGVVKLSSGDLSWKNLTALEYHYQTQPLPNWISYWFHHLPSWVQRESGFIMFIFELVVPFFIFVPGRIRILGAVLLVLFQILIILTGNYGFFNILTIALCILLIPDRDWPGWIKRKFYAFFGPKERKGIRAWPKLLITPLVLLLLVLSISKMERRLSDYRIFTDNFGWLLKWTAPFHFANNYGLFAVMTKNRPEITVEGSRDGKTWVPYEFKWKPGDLKKRPRFVAPHMPRLDWQMWFAGLRPPGRYPGWFHNFLVRLLEGSPEVLALLGENPFPGEPPRYVRANVANYYFSSPKLKKETGEWWVKGESRPYAPVYEKVGERIIRRK